MGDFATERRKVFVTGFGPFGNHIVNASWVAVQELERIGLGNDVDLVTEEIPVEYTRVQKCIPDRWAEHKPDLTIHVGVSGIAKELTLEQRAHNDGYDKGDVFGQFPEGNVCVDGAPCMLVSKIDMKKVRDAVNNSLVGVQAIVSIDPGRYLCDFIYFTSLHICTSNTAFIHVPPLNKPYSGRQLGEALRVAIRAMLENLS